MLPLLLENFLGKSPHLFSGYCSLETQRQCASSNTSSPTMSMSSCINMRYAYNAPQYIDPS